MLDFRVVIVVVLPCGFVVVCFAVETTCGIEPQRRALQAHRHTSERRHEELGIKGSNLEPPESESGALPIELIPSERKLGVMASNHHCRCQRPVSYQLDEPPMGVGYRKGSRLALLET